VVDVTTGQLASGGEVTADELAKARGVVVPHGLGIAERLQHRVGLHDLLLQGAALARLAALSLLLSGGLGGADDGEVGDYLERKGECIFKIFK